MDDIIVELPNHVIRNILYSANLTIDIRYALKMKPQKININNILSINFINILNTFFTNRVKNYNKKKQLQIHNLSCAFDNKPNIDINIQAQHLTLEIIEIDNIIIICIEIIKVKPETEEIIVLSKFSYNIHTGEEVPYPLDEDDDE